MRPIEPTQILLTGRPGVGKTSAVRRTAEVLSERGLPVAGFYTEEMRHERRRVGFRGVPFGGGESLVIAHVRLQPSRVGRYGVDVDAIDLLSTRHLEPVDEAIVLVDEIGKMECLSATFVAAMRRLLDSGRPLLATVGLGGGEFMRSVRQRRDALHAIVTESNRDRIPERAARWLAARDRTLASIH